MYITDNCQPNIHTCVSEVSEIFTVTSLSRYTKYCIHMQLYCILRGDKVYFIFHEVSEKEVKSKWAAKACVVLLMMEIKNFDHK